MHPPPAPLLAPEPSRPPSSALDPVPPPDRAASPDRAAPPAPDRATSLALATAGPVGLGAVLAARLGDTAPLVAVPVVVFAVAALTLPALYIAAAVIGVAPPLGQMARAAGRGLHALGLVHLGLALPLAFLAVTSSAGTGFALGAVALAGGALIGLRAFRGALFAVAEPGGGRGLLFGTWAVVALVIGARLFTELTLEVAS